MNPCTRRRFLGTITVAGATAWAASRVGFLSGSSLAPRPMMSQGSVLDLSLTAQAGRLSLAGRPTTLYSYNGSVPGPRLEIRPGDHVRIRFTNRLPELTNLHFHGLHAPPTVTPTTCFSKSRQWKARSMSLLFPRIIAVVRIGTIHMCTTLSLVRCGLAS